MSNVYLWGAVYDTDYVDLPKQGGGNARFSEGGGTPSQTQHTLYWEYSDSTSETETAYWDGTFISDAILATVPTTHNNKTVTLAELDGVAWYEPSAIPLNTQLIDYNAVSVGYVIDSSGAAVSSQWTCASDYTLIDPSMTFTYRAARWEYIALYDESHNAVSVIEVSADGTPVSGDSNTAEGTLSGNKIPATAKYVRLSCAGRTASSSNMSLIRTA